MSIKVFTDITGQSVMYDSNSEIAFGPVFGEDEDPADFLEWLKSCNLWGDPAATEKDELSRLIDKWRKEVKENEDEAANERAMNDTEATTLDEVCYKAKMLK